MWGTAAPNPPHREQWGPHTRCRMDSNSVLDNHFFAICSLYAISECRRIRVRADHVLRNLNHPYPRKKKESNNGVACCARSILELSQIWKNGCKEMQEFDSVPSKWRRASKTPKLRSMANAGWVCCCISNICLLPEILFLLVQKRTLPLSLGEERRTAIMSLPWRELYKMFVKTE